MPRIPDQIASNFIDGALDLEAFTQAERVRVLAMLERLEKDLVRELESTDPTAVQRTQFRRARLQQLLNNTKRSISQAYGKIARDQESRLADLAALSSKRAVDATNLAVGADLLSTILTKEQAASIASGVMIDGARSRDWWAKQGDSLSFAFQQQLQQGMVRGETLAELRNRIMADPETRPTPGIGVANKDLRSVGDVGERNIIKAARRNAESLVRSSIQVANNDAHMATFAANQDVVKGLVWLSTLDTRTTATCISLDKHRWQYKDGGLVPVGHDKQFPGPTAHWGCRSTQIPWLKPWSELSTNKAVAKKLDEIAPGTRASMDGQVSDSLDYQSWLKGQPEARQIEVLGRARYELFKADKLDLSNLTDSQGAVLTLKDLAARVGDLKPAAPPVPKIDGTREGAKKWATEWHEATWTQDWLKQVVNTFKDPIEDTRKTSTAYFQRAFTSDEPGMLNMGGNTASTDRGKMVWMHEYGHHMDDQLGRAELARENRYGFHPLKSKGPWSYDISSSERGQQALAADAKLYKGKKLNAAEARNLVGKWDAAAQDEIFKVYDKMAEEGATLKEATPRNAALRWFAGKDDAYSKVARAMVNSNDADPFRLIGGALSGDRNTQIAALSGSLSQANRVFFNDLMGAITKNKIGYGHSDAYYKSNWAHQGAEAFANTVALANLGALGEAVVEFASPEFGSWVLGLLRSLL